MAAEEISDAVCGNAAYEADAHEASICAKAIKWRSCMSLYISGSDAIKVPEIEIVL